MQIEPYIIQQARLVFIDGDGCGRMLTGNDHETGIYPAAVNDHLQLLGDIVQSNALAGFQGDGVGVNSHRVFIYFDLGFPLKHSSG